MLLLSGDEITEVDKPGWLAAEVDGMSAGRGLKLEPGELLFVLGTERLLAVLA